MSWWKGVAYCNHVTDMANYIYDKEGKDLTVPRVEKNERIIVPFLTADLQCCSIFI